MTDKCVNYILCGGEKVPGIGSDFCMGCGSWFKVCGYGWNALTFIECKEECVICLNECTRKIMFPANCGHSFCIPCTQEIFFWDGTKYDLSPVPFGCPPCPNGCENPIQGRQCFCDEYETLVEKWSEENKDEYAKWDTAKEIILEKERIYKNEACPLCRKKYERS